LPDLLSSRRIAAVAALAVSMLALAACGGGDDTSATTDTTQGTPLTESDYVSQANAICATANDQLAALQADVGANPTQEQLDQFYADAEPIIEEQVNALSALGAPEGETAQVDAMNEAMQQALEQFKQDPESTQALTKSIDKQADALGLKAECGSDSDK